MYKVEYKTDTGSPSDNEFIGIYTTKGDAGIAKQKYIDYSTGGSEQEYCKSNQSSGRSTMDLINDYHEEVQRLKDCVVIEPALNNMMNTFQSKLNKF